MRIISLVPSVTETLFELGLDDQIVAITRWCTRPAEKVIDKPKVGGTKNPKLQSILEWKPDIVILDCDENRKEDAEKLEKNGIRTFTVFPKTIDDSIRVIRQLGELFGFHNVFAHHPQRYPPLTAEEIGRMDPEMILFPDEPYPFRQKHLDLFQQEFPGTRAVRNQRLFSFDGSYIAWHGFGTLRALREFPLLFLDKK